jgi:N-acetylmuramic acid 6-phosphate etherase
MPPPDLPPTERPNPRSADLGALTAAGLVGLLLREEAESVARLPSLAEEVAKVVEYASASLRRGGRLIYVGAGTSGRLGVQDAVECVPTFRCDPAMVVGVIAGGDAALKRSIEGAEDDSDGGRAAMHRLGVCSNDTIVGIAACGHTPFVCAALSEAKKLGAAVALVSAGAPDRSLPLDVHISLPTGPEVLTGSTRLKAGTATKIILNAISTATMVRRGKVYRNLMVDLRPTNEKLRKRAVRLVVELAGVDAAKARETLLAAGWEVKTSVLALRASISPAEARAALAACDGFLGRALADR